MIRKHLNYIKLKRTKVGDERRLELEEEILNNGTFLPQTLTYEDIDKSFAEWVKSLEIVSEEGKFFPTMTLYSNQRFSEYNQSWRFVDENKNLMLNFKTITRESDPEFGTIQNHLWNIPGNRFYTIKKKLVLDKNGSESYLVLKAKQPVPIDMVFKLSIFTNKFTSINEFNQKINKAFAARQAYIAPNGHYIPMILENISDASQYNIDDRQFYAQTYQIKVMGYIITKEDYRVEEWPARLSLSINNIKNNIKPDVEIEESEEDETTTLTATFSTKTTSKFKIDINFSIQNIELDNVKSFKIYSNDELLGNSIPMFFEKDSEIKICIEKKYKTFQSKITFYGTNSENDYEIENIE